MIQYLYPTPIYCCPRVDNFETIQEEIDKCIDKVDFRMRKNWGATHYLSFPSFDVDVLKKYELWSLSKEIDRHLKAYCSELDIIVQEYTKISWLTKFEKGNYGHIHNHGYCDIAGCYYYKTNGEDGDLFFMTPNPHLDTTKCYIDKFGAMVNHKPQEGKICLFPGWLDHGIRTNETDNTRMSLAFNIRLCIPALDLGWVGKLHND